MKLSKNVLVGSLASAGIVLGALAPAVSVQAAKTSGAFDADGSTLTHVTDESKKDVGSLNDAGHGLAIAYDDSASVAEGTAPTYDKATATSNANVNVISGVLVLDAVPNFGFGSGAAGSTVSLNPNQVTSGEGVDGNDKGLLQVTDARTAKGTNDTKGFTLNANLGNFKNAVAGDTSTVNGADAFTLNLVGQELMGGDGKSAATGATAIKTNDAALTSDASDKAVMSPIGGSYKVGALKVAFDKAESASLVIPGATGGDTSAPSSHALTSMITWTLDSTPVAK